MAHRYHRYTDSEAFEDVSRKFPNRIRYIAMAIRPADVLLLCCCLTIIISVACILVLMRSTPNSVCYDISIAILTGVIASGLVSISIELANNYRHNRQRYVVLNEYLYMVSMYEEFMVWASHGNYEEFSNKEKIDWFARPLKVTPRIKAVAELILIFGPIIEAAILNGSEYLSIKELQCATRAVDAADKLGEHAESIVKDHYKMDQSDIYSALDSDLRGKIIEFSKDVEIYFENHDLCSVVCDYVLSNIEDFGTDSIKDEDGFSSDCSTRDLMIHCLWNFDEAMHELQQYVVMEPVFYDNLVPFEKKEKELEDRIAKMRKNYED